MQNFQGWKAGHAISLDKKYFSTVVVINTRSPTVGRPNVPAARDWSK
jgi:hypothetical protein